MEFKDKHASGVKIADNHAVGIGTKEEMEKFAEMLHIDTYYNFDKPTKLRIRITPEHFQYIDKSTVRILIDGTLYSRVFIYRIIENVIGKPIITKTKPKRPYKNKVGNLYTFDLVRSDQKLRPIFIGNMDGESDAWFVVAPIIDD